MNTLSREITSRFFANAEAYQQLRTHWRALINSPRKHELKAEHHLLYVALLGKDWRKGFSPITNPRKLANGAWDGWRMRHALQVIHRDAKFGDADAPLLQPFDGLVTLGMVASLHALLPDAPNYSISPKDFATGYPFDAYLNEGAKP